MERIFSKDSFWLLFWGLAASIAAWAFWHYTGEHGFQIIIATVLISLIFDNRRMRNKIEQYEEQGNGSEKACSHDQAND